MSEATIPDSTISEATQHRLVYMTASSRQEALAIGRTLVEQRLVACVNILDNMTSIYWWQGKIEEGSEVVLLAKTREEKLPDVIKTVRRLHSYECPCVVAVPITHGFAGYLRWIEAQTGSPSPP